MHRTGEFRIGQGNGLTALEIPYKGRELSMLLLVPDEVEGLAAVEGSLDAKKLDTLDDVMAWESVVLALPRFEINPNESLSLDGDLRALGMPLAFDEDRADFTGMADPTDFRDGLVISRVFHKGFVRVDEKGTEAAAATAVVMKSRGGPAPGPHCLHVDRPFLFLIRDNATGLVLFLGRIADPSPF